MPCRRAERGAGDLDPLAVEADFARASASTAPDEDLDQRRLAGAVLAEDRVHFAAPQIEVDVLQRGDAAIFLADALSSPGAALCDRRSRHGVAPSSANEATTPSPLAAK